MAYIPRPIFYIQLPKGRLQRLHPRTGTPVPTERMSMTMFFDSMVEAQAFIDQHKLTDAQAKPL